MAKMKLICGKKLLAKTSMNSTSILVPGYDGCHVTTQWLYSIAERGERERELMPLYSFIVP